MLKSKDSLLQYRQERRYTKRETRPTAYVLRRANETELAFSTSMFQHQISTWVAFVNTLDLSKYTDRVKLAFVRAHAGDQLRNVQHARSEYLAVFLELQTLLHRIDEMNSRFCYFFLSSLYTHMYNIH